MSEGKSTGSIIKVMRLGVNIDHVATLRQARGGREPDPVAAAFLCEANGAESIVAHLREDRRHIQDRDILLLKKTVRTKFNLEMSVAEDIVRIAVKLRPDQATLVPEKRQELTTEGGLDVAANMRKIREAALRLAGRGIEVSLFIEPVKKQIDAAGKAGARMIELHTGRYADALDNRSRDKYFQELKTAAHYAKDLGMAVNAGHGLDYNNVSRVASIKEIEELNIGYSIVCRAVMAGLAQAVREMKALI